MAERIENGIVGLKRRNPRAFGARGFQGSSLTMSYFHTGIRTIIGAEAFHCPVRDGKEWDHLAMVIRLNLSPPCDSFSRSHKTANSQSRCSFSEQFNNQFLIAQQNSVEDRHNTPSQSIDSLL